MNKKKIKRAMTLVELMIVMVLIGVIGGALAVNLKGSLEKGRYFRSIEGKKHLEQAFELEMMEKNLTPTQIVNSWEKIAKNCQWVSGGEKALSDGWGYKYQVQYNRQKKCLEISSKGIEEYEQSQKD